LYLGVTRFFVIKRNQLSDGRFLRLVRSALDRRWKQYRQIEVDRREPSLIVSVGHGVGQPGPLREEVRPLAIAEFVGLGLAVAFWIGITVTTYLHGPARRSFSLRHCRS
jgi:hypothetical protein